MPKKRRHAASHPAERPRKAPRSNHNSSPFPDFASYMAEKNRKLRAQFDAEASAGSSVGAGSSLDSIHLANIFRGVSIFVDGFQFRPARGYMLKHGGRYVNYFSRHTVTHIICSNLPESKIKNLRTFSHGLPVVRPEWVLDSVAANKLLSCVPYQLGEHVHGTYKQQKLSSFFHNHGTASLSAAEAPGFQKNKADEDSKHSKLPQEGHTSNCQGQSSGELVTLKNQEKSRGVHAELEFTDLKDDFSTVEASDSCAHSCPSMVKRSYSDDEKVKESCVKSLGGSNCTHSTLTDPNFVENYFKSSRLHFIGTWRNRYRKHFSKFLSGVKSNAKVRRHSGNQKAAIIHLDMDCFFVSVVIRKYPGLLDKPVAVCHSNNSRGTAEISSANYAARDYGIGAGMFVRDAKARCPDLVILPYDFEAYEEVADQFYSILHKHCDKVQALSCDEAFLDVTGYDNDPEKIASEIRKEIVDTTYCTASAGIAENLLLARLATKSAKPNGQLLIPSEKVEDYLNDLPVKALPGIGRATSEKLKRMEIQTCGQMRDLSKETLQKDFGLKIGDMLWNYCRGNDNRTVETVQETKSIGAEVNWGIRFNGSKDCDHFLSNLCKEVSLRLQACGVQGRTVTLKVKLRRKGAEEPEKFMGCGDCESMSRSTKIPLATDNKATLHGICRRIFASLQVDVREVRGIGLQISRLESMDINSQGLVESALEKWLTSSMENTMKCCDSSFSDNQRNIKDALLTDDERQSPYDGCLNQQDNRNSQPSCTSVTGYGHPCGGLVYAKPSATSTTAFPPLCDLDIEVVKNLPTEIVSEMNDIYKGELSDFIRKHQEKDNSLSNSSSEESLEEKISILSKGNDCFDTNRCIAHVDQLVPELGSGDKAQLPLSKPSNRAGFVHLRNSNTNAEVQIPLSDNIKGSLDQVDKLVLQQLPNDAKTTTSEFLPAQRKLSFFGNSPSCFNRDFHNVECGFSQCSRVHLWSGSPQEWVKKFKISNCLILNAFADLYIKSTDKVLSSILLSLGPFLPLVFEASTEEQNEALYCLHELLVEYIYMKISSDLEELYNCFCFLRRFSSGSKFLVQVYNRALPLFQAAVNENYGGQLQLSLVEE